MEDLVPLLSGFIGVLIGAVATYFSNKLIHEHQQKIRGDSIKSALITEIDALIKICDSRNYKTSIENVITQLKIAPHQQKFQVTVKIPEHYSRIYQENASEIGLLDKDTAAKIVQFHQYIDAVIQDIIPGGNLSVGAGLDSFEENLNIFNKALSIGSELTTE